MQPPLLVVDDDPLITDSLSFVLGRDYAVRTASSRAEALRSLGEGPLPVAALIDLGLPPTPHSPAEGFGLIGDILARSPDTRIIVLSGQNEEANARHARALGATEFTAKPADPLLLRQLIKRVIDLKDKAPAEDGLIGDSLALATLRQQIRQFADSPFPVLIQGESGTGKELVARALHRHSSRNAGPLLALNCAAIAPGLMDAALFGAAKGAFTGATAARSGFFEDTGNGTLFLDEIGELPLDLQPKLLRVLETGEFQRLGETAVRKSMARVLCATNRDLSDEVRNGRFRADLFHRLSVLPVTVPALRDRGDDARLLLDHFLADYSRQTATSAPRLSVSALSRLKGYPFPGNVRELRNIAIRLCAKHPGADIDAMLLEAEFDVTGDSTPAMRQPEQEQEFLPMDDRVLLRAALAELRGNPAFSLESRLRAIEGAYIAAAQAIAEGNLSQAAKILGLSRTTLYHRLAVLERDQAAGR